MVAVALALGSSVMWGLADFLGGVQARRVPLAAVMAFVTIFTDYKVLSKYLLWLVAVFATYILAAFLARPNWGEVLRSTVVPQLSFSRDYLLGAVALLGTTITPYLFFWQASGEVEERRGVQGISRRDVDITAGMVWSNCIAFFIIWHAQGVLSEASIQSIQRPT